MYTLILSDGTEIKNLTLNGTNFVSEEPIDTSIFKNNLSTLTIISETEYKEEYENEDGEVEKTLRIEPTIHTMHNAEFIQQQKGPDGWYICFRELSRQELFERAVLGKLDYIAMMSDVDLGV